MVIKEIKSISADVQAAFQRLIPQLSATARIPSLAHLEALVQSPHVFLLAVYADDTVQRTPSGGEGGQIVGILTLAKYLIPTGERFWIEDVVIDERVRGKGVGKLLTGYAIQFAKAQGATAIELTSNPNRVVANQLYQSLGFKRRETNTYRLTF
jgi:ribosomal protein S18 acetylase RimI-like enzyme